MHTLVVIAAFVLLTEALAALVVVSLVWATETL